jgi:hypothetical protein
MDELAYSRNRHGGRRLCVGGRFSHSKFFAALMATSTTRSAFMTKKRTRNAGVPIACDSFILHTLDFNSCHQSRTDNRHPLANQMRGIELCICRAQILGRTNAKLTFVIIRRCSACAADRKSRTTVGTSQVPPSRSRFVSFWTGHIAPQHLVTM